jgi:hypothetical protein
MTDALEGERQLALPIPSLTATRGASGWSSVLGWDGTPTTDFLVFESYFDCSAYTRDGLTVFPIASALQDPGSYQSTQTVPFPVQVVDIISQVRLSSSDVYAGVQANTLPGMLGTDVDFTQIIWGQYRTFLPQTNFTSATELLPANGAMFGSGSPSTAEKLYVYRFVFLPTSSVNDTIRVPASRMLLSVLVGEEKELAFLMRQKRSYELKG